MEIYCMAQETQTGALNQPKWVGWRGRWEGGSEGRGYMYTCGWLMLRFNRKQQNSVKQLPFNKKSIEKRIDSLDGYQLYVYLGENYLGGKRTF